MADEVFTHTREQREDNDVVVQAVVGHHGLLPVGLQHAVAVVDDVDASIDEVGIVERLEGVELLSTLLGGTVATQQVTIEIDANLWHHGMAIGILGGCNLDRGDEVLLTVGAQLSDGQLGTCEDDWLGQILQHVGEGRGGIGHRVRTMQHHEAIVVVVMIGDAV